MYIILDNDGYVKFLSSNTPMEGAIELPDDDTINLDYISCYKLNSDGTGLMLDAEKLAAQKDSLGAQSKIFELKQKLNDSDYKILERIREQALGTTLSISDNEYLMLEAERESYVRQIRQLQDGSKLVTDINKILKEGKKVRQDKIDAEENMDKIIEKTIPELQKGLEELIKTLNNGDLVKKIIEEIKKTISIKDLLGGSSTGHTDPNAPTDGKDNSSSDKGLGNITGGLFSKNNQTSDESNKSESEDTETAEETTTTEEKE